jgi:hypothetical protein
MKLLAVLAVCTTILLAAPAAWAGVDWGADAFSAPKGAVNQAELAMGARFESFAIYSNIDRAGAMDSKKVTHAIEVGAMIYVNINSHIIGKRGTPVPICFSAVAAGHRDQQLQAWARGILATHYSNFVITFNHEPMWRSASQPKCSPRYDNPTTYKAAWSHVRKLFIADGILAKWAYVMTWGATKGKNALLYRPPPRTFQVIGTDQYYGCHDDVYAPADAFKSFFDWTAQYARTKEVLVGEIGALTTCPVRSLRWLEAGKARLLAHNVLAVNWNLRTDAGKEFNPLLQPDIRAWWLDWAADETGG